MNCIYIGDVHSNAYKLKQLLDSLPSNAFLVFLGDLFDCRDEPANLWQYDSAQVLDIVLDLQAQQRCVVLQSNHQHKLMRHLLGKKVYITPSLQSTLADFAGSKHSEFFLKHWLLSLPYGFSTSINGIMYRAAHAYYVQGMNEIAPSKYARGIALYGFHKQFSYEREQWWLEPKPAEQDFVRIAGHYHDVFIDEHSIVLDDGCGSGGKLMAYAPEARIVY